MDEKIEMAVAAFRLAKDELSNMDREREAAEGGLEQAERRLRCARGGVAYAIRDLVAARKALDAAIVGD